LADQRNYKNISLVKKHENFINQLTEYLILAEEERREEISNIFEETAEELKDAQETIQETEQI
jgi:hypothetical protein